jgi:hypothetical protein
MRESPQNTQCLVFEMRYTVKKINVTNTRSQIGRDEQIGEKKKN